MKSLGQLFFIILVLPALVFAQEKEKKELKPVRNPFESAYLIDQQTSVIPTAKTMEFVIQHKFGTIQNGLTDLYGIYAPGANIRLAMNYSLIKNLQIGYGITKKNMYSDFNVKYTALEQTRGDEIPVSITVFANAAIDGRPDETFGVDYKFNHRFSYFSQLIIGRKFTHWLSLQAAGSFTHYNMVDPMLDHDKIAFHAGGRVKFSPQSSVLFNYDIPIPIAEISEQREFINHPKHNLSIGYEVCTSTHAFQIYLGTANGILPQDMVMYNQNDYTLGDLMFGFTMTRLWSF